MYLDSKRFLAVLTLFSFAFAVGCDFGPKRVAAPSFKPSAEAAAAMEMFDANKDGKIAGAELDACPGLKASLKIIGTDREKGVTKEQIAERIQKWLNLRTGRTSLTCQVTRNGQPLTGATVKFVPEKFLEDVLPETAIGKTTPNGMATISLPADPKSDIPSGVTLGMYRVEITKDGETIPAKYNSNTELGQEVSPDNLYVQPNPRFDLKY
jgi:hypothetical protein